MTNSRYVELHCHSNFSLLDGASHPEVLVEQAAKLHMPALALTDHNAVYGAVRFAEAAKAHGIKPIFGAEVTLDNGHHLTLLVENEAGWHNLCYLISRARHNAEKGQAVLPYDDLAGHASGLIALSGCEHGEITSLVLQGMRNDALSAGRRYAELFGPAHFWIELQHHLLPQNTLQVAKLVDLAKTLGVGYVAANNVHYARRDGHRLQDILVCIHHGVRLDSSEHLRRPNSEYYLKSPARMAAIFHEYPEAITNTLVIARQCQFDLAYGLQDLPEFSIPDGLAPAAHLAKLCQAAMRRRYSNPAANIRERLKYELQVIENAGLSNYFLIVWDVVRYARENNIRCQGRGSAANSLVAYLLDITPIDPLAHNLVFERFLSDERKIVPDIDIDFEAGDPREKVIQYIYQKYGADHAAMACTFVTFRARSAIRDVGKVLGFPLYLIDQAAKTMDFHRSGDISESAGFQDVVDGRGAALPWQQLIDLTQQISGFPRHLGIHNGGMVMMKHALDTRLPSEPATMPDRVVVQWDKDALEQAGLVKLDILGLRMLSAIGEAVEIIKAATGKAPDLNALTFDDPKLYEMISKGDTIGVFQVESRAQAQVLPLLKPQRFEDIIISISLIRPGPIQGNMVHPYMRRRLGEEEVKYPHPLLEPALKDTLGVILFQEDVLKVARDLAGFTAGRGEQLRRALGSKRSYEEIEKLHQAFVQGAIKKGVEELIAESVFNSLLAFGGYSFPKSHAAAFAVIVYQSAWLKYYHPQAFLVGLLNNQPLGFWSPAVLVNDAKRRGIRTLPADINKSGDRCAVEGKHVRLGLNYVKGLGEASLNRIVAERAKKPFIGLADFCNRTHLPKGLVENLILVGAMDGWRKPRRSLLWELGKLRYPVEELDLVFPDEPIDLPPFSGDETMAFELGITGVSTSEHPINRYKQWLEKHGVMGSADLLTCEPDRQVLVAGLPIVHQAPPTAKGFHFITLEDQDGLIDIIVNPDTYEQYRRILRSAAPMIVEGRLQRKEGVINVIAKRAALFPISAETGSQKAA